jgi:uncharacterized membrane protein YfcA
VPVLLMLYPDDNPETITSISLAVIFFNAASGSIAYARMKRIDYRSGFLFGAATVPGAILGALTTHHLPRHTFEILFGILMLAACAFLILNPEKKNHVDTKQGVGHMFRCIVDADGKEHTYCYNPVLGIVISFVTSYVASLLGLAGGIIHVPALVHLLNFPVHIATATSHFILAIMSFTGTSVHAITGSFHGHGIYRSAALAIGVIIGAQLGARLSKRVHGKLIIRFLGIALGFVGIRILWMGLQ